MYSSSIPATLAPSSLTGLHLPWHLLTVIPEKQAAYTEDGYFREGWEDFVQFFGTKAPAILHRTTLALLKPEAFYGGKARLALGALEGQGFTPIAAAPVHYNSRLIHGVWQYNTNTATVDRILLQTRHNCPHTTLVVALTDRRPEKPLPASLRLKFFKGSAAPEGRRPDTLRAILQSPNGLLNFVHSPEEPADIVRELAIYLDVAPRHLFLQAITRDQPISSLDHHIGLQAIEPKERPQTLDASTAASRINKAAARNVLADPRLAVAYERLSTYLAAILSRRQTLHLAEFERLLQPLGLYDLHEDIYIFGTYFIPYNRPNSHPWYPEKLLARWYHQAAAE